MSKRKLMILGAGLCQVPIIQKAQQMGFETIAVSAPGDYPGFSVADRSYHVDVRDKVRILEIARQDKIDGILTDQTDISVPSVAYVAENMGLPGIGYECALRFTDKHLMRQCCEEIGIPVPRYSQASSLLQAYERAQQLGYPLVVKPVDNQGSRGVLRVDQRDELENKFQVAMSHSAVGRVILEEFFPGTEIVVQGFVSDHEVLNLITGDREYFDLPDGFIPSQSLFPSLLDERLKQKILDLNHYLVKSFRPRFGITHNEYLVNQETGEVRLGEVAIRGGGVFISSDLVPLASGIDLNELLIRLASGEENVRIDRSQIRKRASGYVCFSLPEGTIRRVRGVDNLNSLPGVHRTHLQEIQVGSQTRRMTDKAMRLGPILLSARDRLELQEIIDRVRDTLVVEVETEEGIKGIEW